MNSTAEIRLAALQLALRDAVAAFDIVLLRVWIAYLVIRGWVLAWITYPAGYRVLRAETRHAPCVLVLVYERAALAQLDALGTDAAGRYQRSILRLASAERRPPAEVLGDLLALQALSWARSDTPVAGEAVAVPVVQLPAVVARAPANDAAMMTHKNLGLDAFLRLHPRLLPVLARLARETIRVHGARVSINALFERLRADIELYREACGGTLPPKTRNGLWRLDNSHRAAVGRLLAASEPELARHLDLRRSRADQDPLVTTKLLAFSAGVRRAS